jgi:hypothetical protein
MTATTAPHLDRIRSLLAEKGYEVSEQGANILRIREVGSGVVLQAALEGDILFFSLVCVTVPAAAITPQVMRKMLDAANGISTSHFQLYDMGNGQIAVSLNNFCKLQDMGADDQDDILSCINFLLVDVIAARDLVGGLLK